ncbi:MAG: hypothetical protein A2675_00505 [Candidatus Yonathbacteria bacterium RIFCSPHIGHO2_01_FULL_51_10]|uniref:Uncharacterized protein n=1 Tax=Candidatus Yonathbacteria bacterium RIFCSPHIGHO2_01_FULL_51_10 TaxID=1802723 RepID=A0A1G2SB64_9BACT|nr:MAG: hypothetical protein A2675_00505 [Candidatus Yonathbacteria bacterium RIFCSPHIGHO2_01_FULL_51_10]
MKTKNFDLLLILGVFMIASYILVTQAALNPNVNPQTAKMVIIISFSLFFLFLFREVNKRKKQNLLTSGSVQKSEEIKNQSRLAKMLIILGVVSVCFSVALIFVGSSWWSEFIVGIFAIFSGYLIKRNT